jgi:hypothetical protein
MPCDVLVYYFTVTSIYNSRFHLNRLKNFSRSIQRESLTMMRSIETCNSVIGGEKC